MKSDSIKARLHELFTSDKRRYIQPSDLFRSLLQSYPKISRKTMRAALSALVESGALIYTSRFGVSHLELNYNRAVQISEHIFLAPENETVRDKEDTICVYLKPGGAFGAGDHPTTRLCLKAVDQLFSVLGPKHELKIKKVLDIGTGSGVLAIAALLFGASSAVGVDIDPVARVEAAENAKLNRVSDRFSIVGQMAPLVWDKSFQLMFANLRPPTLRKLIPAMTRVSRPDGCSWVLSGFRPDESKTLKKMLGSLKGSIIYSLSLEEWSCLIAVFKNNKYRAFCSTTKKGRPVILSRQRSLNLEALPGSPKTC